MECQPRVLWPLPLAVDALPLARHYHSHVSTLRDSESFHHGNGASWPTKTEDFRVPKLTIKKKNYAQMGQIFIKLFARSNFVMSSQVFFIYFLQLFEIPAKRPNLGIKTM